jgi:hypothetical protein
VVVLPPPEVVVVVVSPPLQRPQSSGQVLQSSPAPESQYPSGHGLPAPQFNGFELHTRSHGKASHP